MALAAWRRGASRSLRRHDEGSRSRGPLLKSSLIIASSPEDAEAEVKREFTLVQANCGAREYRILEADALVVAAHSTPDEPYRDNL